MLVPESISISISISIPTCRTLLYTDPELPWASVSRLAGAARAELMPGSATQVRARGPKVDLRTTKG